MILSNVRIQQALDDGDIVLSPEPRRKPTRDDPSCAYDPSSVNLRLSENISIPQEGKPFTFDLRRGGLAPFLAEICEHKKIDREGGYSLQPKKFILGRTIERVQLLIKEGRPVFAARVEGRSSLARCGLLVHFTAPTVHAGYDGTLTLEMINLGCYPITLYPEMEVCQLIFEMVEGTPVESPSQFQGQTTPVGTSA
jgi:dCTP deaminase